MADKCSYSSEERWLASVLVHEGQHTAQTVNQLKTVFNQRRWKPSPPQPSLLSYEKQVVPFGKVKDFPGRGQPCPERWLAPLLPLALNSRLTNPNGKEVNGSSSTDFGRVWHRQEGRGDVVIYVRVCKRTQRCRHETTSRSMYFVAGTNIDSLVSREILS